LTQFGSVGSGRSLYYFHLHLKVPGVGVTGFTFAVPHSGSGRFREAASALFFALSVLVAVSLAGAVPAILGAAIGLALRCATSAHRMVLIVLVLAGCTGIVTAPALKPAEKTSFPAFHARRAAGEITPLPSLLSHVIADDAEFVLSYQEKISQRYTGVPDDIALYITGIFHIFGVPLGSNEVRVTANLTLTAADREPFNLRAEASASSTYGFYYGAKMSQLDEQARRHARLAIDRSVVDGLTRWMNGGSAPAGA
jgi:hypothetical protein